MASDSSCVVNPDPLSIDRPLLSQFRAIYTDAVLQTWKWDNYDMAYNSLKPINGVSLNKVYNPTGQFVDRRVGGATLANILKGLNFARTNALKTVPENADILPEQTPFSKYISWGKDKGGVPVGMGWAWNSLTYVLDGDVYEVVYFYHGFYIHEACGAPYCDGDMTLIANGPALICKSKLPVPAVDPPGSPFGFQQLVSLSNIVPGTSLFYRLDTNNFRPYTGDFIHITNDIVIQAFSKKPGWLTSDTISEVYTKTNNPSKLQLGKISEEPLGGNSYLNENDSGFVIKLTTPHATLTEVSISFTSIWGLDKETISIKNPQVMSDALVFIDTIDFAVKASSWDNSIVEAAIYDSITVSWTNPILMNDNPNSTFLVKPELRDPVIYFADSNWNELADSLSGTESILYVVVEDAVFNPAHLDEYRVSLSNKKGGNNNASTDFETYPLVEITPGTYGATIPLEQSPPVKTNNDKFEIKNGDELKAVYVNPVTLIAKSDLIGFGVPNQLPGLVSFTNTDGSLPVDLISGNIWDASKGLVYLKYTDDFVGDLVVKQVLLTVESTDGMGRKRTDAEMVSMTRTGKVDDQGIWTTLVPLEDNYTAISGDGKLQYYFKGVITASIATHLPGPSEVLEGDTVKAVLQTARANSKEIITMGDPLTNGKLTRNSQSIEICVQDQVYSKAWIDTLLLTKVKCLNSGDMLKNIPLVQKAIDSPVYCGTITKLEAQNGTGTDSILHCQDIDNILSNFVDPVYGTEDSEQETIIDATITRLQFFNTRGQELSSFSEVNGNQILVRLTDKTPSLYTVDTLQVSLESSNGDTLTIAVVETGVNSSVFEGLADIGFSEIPDLDNTVLEGKLDPSSGSNQTTLTATKGNISGTVLINAAYVPAEKAWIVDGNHDGRGDSIYIKFAQPLPALPSLISSIDWPGEGSPNLS
ncbi:MAG: hypothetical protein HQK83_20390, partial [Fibrobacteria bacterium]|nr:hypothetical protein [Fibrobacteria bacterium]